MYGQAHAGLGWAVGALIPGADRRLRAWCTSAAILPDIDALTYVFGGEAYDKWHHTFGHNIFTGLIYSTLCAWHYRDRSRREQITATILTAACFTSHLLTDMKLSGWLVEIFWPVSTAGYEFHPNLTLGSPINEWLVYGFMAFAVVLIFVKGVTPLDLISPRLDRAVVNAFRKKTLSCGECAKPCNNTCDSCGRPVCMKHGRISLRFRITCPACVSAGKKGKPAEDGS